MFFNVCRVIAYTGVSIPYLYHNLKTFMESLQFVCICICLSVMLVPFDFNIFGENETCFTNMS